MRNKWMSRLTLALSVIVVFGAYIDLSSHIVDAPQEKIYFDHRQIHLDDSGFAIEGRQAGVPVLFHDHTGYYITQPHHKTCPCNHVAVTVDQSCAEVSCPYYYDARSL